MPVKHYSDDTVTETLDEDGFVLIQEPELIWHTYVVKVKAGDDFPVGINELKKENIRYIGIDRSGCSPELTEAMYNIAFGPFSTVDEAINEPETAPAYLLEFNSEGFEVDF